MTQASRPQSGRLVDGYVDAGGYTADQWARIYSTLFTLDETTEGVIRHLSDLEVTNPGSPSDDISVASGAALVRGHWFVNEDQATPAGASDVDFVPTTPAADRIDRVVLVQNNTDLAYDGTTDYGSAVLEVPADLTDYDGVASIPAHSCRLAILTGVSGGAMRTLTQDVSVTGDIWMIEIARYTISAAGVISSLTDYREYIQLGAWYRMDNDAIQADLEGDARGDYAIDGQQVRGASTQVASGEGAFIASGRNNTASGDYSYAEGDGVIASAAAAHAEGHGSQATALSAHAEGYGTQATGAESHAEGYETLASGAAAHAEGVEVEAAGAGAHAEGLYSAANAQASHAEGVGSVADRVGQHAFTSGSIGYYGDAQGSRYVVLNDIQHDSDTWRDLTIGGTGAGTDPYRLIIKPDSIWVLSILIAGVTIGCAKKFGYRIDGVVENDGGTPAVLYQNLTVLYESDADFNAQIAVDAATDALLVQVRDTTSGLDTVHWVAVIEVAEVAYPTP